MDCGFFDDYLWGDINIMSRKKLALFDFDKTLIVSDSFIQFGKFACGATRFYWAVLKNSLWLLLWKSGAYSSGKAKEKLFSTLFRGMSFAEFTEKCNQFSKIIDGSLNSYVFNELNRLKHEGAKIVILTASPENWVMPWATAHDINDVIATKIEITSEGLLTGRFKSPNCKGIEKIRRLQERFPNLEENEIYAFGNMPQDKEMLEIATFPTIVG